MLVECDAVAFDADGVLFDSTAAVVQAWTEVCATLGLDAQRVLSHGIPAEHVLAPWVSPVDLPDALRMLEDREVELAAAAHALPGAARLLTDLPDDRTAIVTSASHRLARARLRATGLPVPAVLITADDVTRGKPHPEPYLRAAEQLGRPTSRMVVFEDAPAGITSAGEAGAVVVALATTYAGAHLTADYHVENLAAASVVALEPLTLRLDGRS
jgi:sugar-phosphatase